MKPFSVYVKPSDLAVVVIHTNSPDLLDYIGQGFEFKVMGNMKQCERFIEEFFDENEVLPEAQIYSLHKN